VEISFGMGWSNWNRAQQTQDYVDDTVYLSCLAEDLGFDAVSCVEHHFDPEYGSCPDNFVALSWVGAKTSRIKLVIGAAILPWNDPLRVAEKMALLDRLSGGRAVLGMGRGLARAEYEGFGIAMDESRGRFDEAAELILSALRTGVAEYDGTYYRQSRVEIHPDPRPGLADHVLAIAMSPDSFLTAAEIGGALATFTTGSIEKMAPKLEFYRKKYREIHGVDAPNVKLSDYAYVHPDGARARERGGLFTGRYFDETMRHYEMGGSHFQRTKGYESYQEGARALEDAGKDAARQAYVDAQAGIGTPDEVIEQFQNRYDRMGPTDLVTPFKYGGMGREEAEASMRLFAREVMPELRRINDQEQPAAVEGA
jgi:alkanesulfonate monooxygenase SsuD/methylene tetrahydromethanopterin reductase-like flavin-dependent oxidoreductase (luciferase family)